LHYTLTTCYVQLEEIKAFILLCRGIQLQRGHVIN
jgi:hypothetical protein